MFNARSIGWLLALPLIVVFSDAARALPAYAAQTAQPCQACHIGGFGPQLTPFGREFKLSGYAMRAADGFTVPVSAMAIAGFVHTDKDQASPPAKNYATNDNFTIDQVNLFLAGGFGDHFGAFAQYTYNGVSRTVSWDNMDLRAVDRVTLWGSDVLFGVTFNNNPTVQDVWNTTPAWGFPYTTSTLSPTPSALPLIAGAFAGNTLGATAYAWVDSHIYGEAGFYWTPGHPFLRALGSSSSAPIDGVAPYFRLAYEQDYGIQNFTLGIFGLFPNVSPSGVGGGPTDGYDDIGVDATYVYMGDSSNIYELNARFTHEEQNLDASFAASTAANSHDTLEDIRLDASYYWRNTIGVTVAPFHTWGSTDTLLYAGNSTFRPNSTGVMLQTDYTFFPNSDSPLGERFNLRLGIQYTAYTEFDGAGTNFDGAGTNASDNNTLRIFLWTAY